MNENLFKRIKEKTNVDKETIIDLARKLQNNNYKDEKTLRSVIRELSSITGKEVSKEKEDRIVSTIIKDKVPKNIEKYI